MAGHKTDEQTSIASRWETRLKSEPAKMWVLCGSLFLLGFALRCGVIAAVGHVAGNGVGEMVFIARRIVRDWVFGDPYFIPTGPTAHAAPLYPYFLALLIKVMPSEYSFQACLALLSAAFAAMQWALLPVAAVRLGLPALAGALGGLFGELNLLYHYTECNGSVEATMCGLLLMLLCVASLQRIERPAGGKEHFVLGSAWGMLMLLQPACLTACAAVQMCRAEQLGRRALRGALPFIAGCMLVIGPWVVRTRITLGDWCFIRDNLGLELSMSFNDEAQPNIEQNMFRSKTFRHPHQRRAEAEEVLRAGEIRYMKSRGHEAMEWIKANPGRAAFLIERRVLDFWIPPRRNILLSGVEAVLAALAFAGLLARWRARDPFRVFYVSLWMLFPIVYYLVQSWERYRYPIQWTLVLLAAVAVHRAWGPREPEISA
jgi:hypothetical protein